DARVSPGQRIADVGAGSGVLSIAAALLGAAYVLAVELDPWAAEVARENAELNGVSAQVEVRAGRVDPEGLPGEPPFDGLVSNIEAGVLADLLPGLVASVEEGGWIVLSGILLHEREAIIQKALSLGLEPDGDDGEEEWWSGAFRVPGGAAIDMRPS
ncbi:MAG: methyltransferase domain-containing protein, partial [Gemmatimonadales bacterium]